jgi:hypothetical protein
VHISPHNKALTPSSRRYPTKSISKTIIIYFSHGRIFLKAKCPLEQPFCFAQSPTLCQVEILLDKEPFRYSRHFLPVLHVNGYNIKSFKIAYPIDFIMFTPILVNTTKKS